jgi:hypothetical protein
MVRVTKSSAVGLASRLCVVAVVFLLPGKAVAQTVYLCTENGRSLVVAGEAGVSGCRALARPEEELQLSPAQPDLAAIARELSAQSARIARLEKLLLGARSAPSLRSLPRRSPVDSFDSRGRTRDLGQDIDRRLDELQR